MTERKSRSVVVSIVEGDGDGNLGTLRVSNGFAEKTFCLNFEDANLVTCTAAIELETMLRTLLISLRFETRCNAKPGDEP